MPAGCQQKTMRDDDCQIPANVCIAALKLSDFVTGFQRLFFDLGQFGGHFPRKDCRGQGFTVQIGAFLQFFTGENSDNPERHAPDRYGRGRLTKKINVQLRCHAFGQQYRLMVIRIQPASGCDDFIETRHF